MKGLNQLVAEVIANALAPEVRWFNFGIKFLYIIFYCVLSYKLLTTAFEKIENSKKTKGD